MKRLILCSSISVCLCLAISGCKGEKQHIAKLPRPVQVIKLGESTKTIDQRFAGVVESQLSSQLSFRVPGTLLEMPVAMGERVKKGELLARLDPHDYEVTIVELEARLAEAKSTRDLAASELARVTQANQASAVAKVNLDRARSGLERAQAAVKVVEQNLKKSQDALRYTELLAPFDGVVASRSAERYEQALPGVPVIELHQADRLQVAIDVPENMIQQFALDMTARVTQSGTASHRTAMVAEVATSPDLFKGTFSVVLHLSEGDLALLPGQNVNVTLPMPVTHHQHCLPYAALTEYDGRSAVLVVNGNTLSPVFVENASATENALCVSGELEFGQNVVVAGAAYLEPGDTIGDVITLNREGAL
ncbi:efflux RND transporter periplasmic adaptor subunit [Thaumasiovibrio subtropicus]|uniref:efflux RND transporter periplasmic adaptor subunit n=1 Tax=Thaumasiovibrio subtropicus TaxID=1891207 RepID=UPI000B356718|nr:efflux RND transporter periplasmic adaptor subunit [Thaumasiovibrio subtropicus]